jgi:hypothetical protein
VATIRSAGQTLHMNGLLRPMLIPAFIIALAVSAGCAAPRSAAPPAEPPPPTTAPILAPAAPADVRQATLIRSPSCDCCGGHAEHLQAAGYAVSSTLTDAYVQVKDAHDIPTEMRSCHTTLVGRYFIEGHVPVAAIEQLLREMPEIDGIALPGMPPGSPGMGGVAAEGLTVFAVDDGQVVGEFGVFEGVGE